MREGIPVKKDRIRWERGALVIRIIAKEKNSKNIFLIVLFSFKI